MLLLRRGDRSPAVVTLQVLLNRSGRTDRVLDLDGIYGAETESAVLSYQQQAGTGLVASGRADPACWQSLTRSGELVAVDSVDAFEPLLLRARPVERLAAAGSRAFGLGVMAGGVEAMVDEVRRQAPGAESIILLRIIGHGHAGLSGVSTGLGGYFLCEEPEATGGERTTVGGRRLRIYDSMVDRPAGGVSYDSSGNHAALSDANVRELAGVLGRLRPLFAPFGSAQLHGCHVAQGPAGMRLLRGLCDAWGVPVAAGTAAQRIDTDEELFRFEGPIRVAYPGRSDLRGWGRRVAGEEAATPGLSE